MNKFCFKTSNWETNHSVGKIGNLKKVHKAPCSLPWMITIRLRPVYSQHPQEHWLSHMQRYSLLCHSSHQSLSMFITHGRDFKKREKITNYLLKVKNKDEGEEREKEKIRVHTCWAADPGHDLALNAIRTNWGQHQPMQSMFTTHPDQEFYQVKESQNTNPWKTTVSKKFRSEDVGS